MFEIILSRFFATSVDKIVAKLDKLETKLVAFAQKQLQKALAEENLADEALARAASTRAEAERALRVAQRVGGLTE